MFAIIIVLLMFSLVMLVAVYPSGQVLSSYRLQLTLTQLITIILISVLLGLFQFFGSVALLVLLLISIYTLKLRSKVGITILGIFFGFCCMVLTVTISIHLQHLEHEYFAGARYFYSLIPAVVTGGGLGLYLASQVKEENEETEKRRVIWFIYKQEEKPWSSKD